MNPRRTGATQNASAARDAATTQVKDTNHINDTRQTVNTDTHNAPLPAIYAIVPPFYK